MAKTETVIRNQIADYINTSTSNDVQTWELCGVGFGSLDETPSAQTESITYVCDSSPSTIIKSYQTQFPFDTKLIKSEKVILTLYNIGRNQKTGADAELDYVRVELFQPTEETNTFKARKFRVAAEIASVKGAGGEVISISGSFKNVGMFDDGTFNTATKTFTKI